MLSKEGNIKFLQLRDPKNLAHRQKIIRTFNLIVPTSPTEQ
jgi:hypothetical protein